LPEAGPAGAAVELVFREKQMGRQSLFYGRAC
jgi:hypothetical protein